MPVVDVHVHVYPEKIAEKASASVGDFYLVPMFGNGLCADYRQAVEGSPITHAIVYSVANKKTQVESINDFIADMCAKHPNFFGFMAMHQDYEDPQAEIERAMGLGLRGIKLHPDSQRVNLDDERLLAVYEIAQDKGLPMVIHCGDYRYDYSHPRRMKRVLRMFPDLVVDAAHFGGWSLYDYALELLEDENCFVDCSSAQTYLGPRRTYELCKAYGTDRVLFGSDYPMWGPVGEYELLKSLPFTAQEFEDMTWHNAERFLGTQIG